MCDCIFGTGETLGLGVGGSCLACVPDGKLPVVSIVTPPPCPHPLYSPATMTTASHDWVLRMRQAV